MTPKKSERLEYIDWMRGLACVLMFQTHCYDSWLSPDARRSHFFAYSQLGGTLPAPLFVFLAGVSSAFVADRLRSKGFSPNKIASTMVRRGALIFGAGVLFRVQEFALGWPHAPWTDLLRVDVLNILGLSIILMGLLVRLTAAWGARPGSGGAADAAGLRPPGRSGDASLKQVWARWKDVVVAAACALLIALATPPLWTTHRPRWLPWYLETYVNGVHILGEPQPWLFPVFPWVAFAFAGLAVGFVLKSEPVRRSQAAATAILGALGAALAVFALWLDARAPRLYSVYDFWHTSPNFFLLRVGVLLVILSLGYIWCRWGFGASRFHPLIQLGHTSLLVYWVHIEFVYGRFSILRKRGMGIGAASLGLLTIFSSMLVLSLLRTWWKERRSRREQRQGVRAQA
ncbi:MAG: heparan-alpha-glucosaminide N-acetyltransferase domain-containing protein [Candidatus Acidiferrales bacterium]|jgi:uncharacterized membrane protein